jgi:hypothetical protein
LAKLKYGSITLDNIYDTLEVAEEYILDVYDKKLKCIYVWYSCMNNSIRVEIPVKEKPVSRIKKFFNLFKKNN